MRSFARHIAWATALLGGLALVVPLAACNDGGGDYGSGYYDSCNQVRTCGACTPIAGCGWCTFADGTGACVADPNECTNAPGFTFTWGPQGCGRTPADASVAPVDGGSSTTTPPDAPPAGDASPATDAPTSSGDAVSGG
jgi:hypothetical protein